MTDTFIRSLIRVREQIATYTAALAERATRAVATFLRSLPSSVVPFRKPDIKAVGNGLAARAARYWGEYQMGTA